MMDLSKPDTICVYCGTDLEEVKRLRSQLCAAREAIRLSLTVGTAYPRDTLAHMDTHTQRALEAILSSSFSCHHAKEAKRLRRALEWGAEKGEESGADSNFGPELLRRAGEGK